MNWKSIKKLILSLLLFFLQLELIGQGTIIKGNSEPESGPPITKIDPARFHKLQIIDFKIGRFYSDDRAFQKLLKNYGYNTGKREFTDIGLNYSYLIKKLNLGLKADAAFQSNTVKPALWHVYWQASLGYALFRKQNKVLTLNMNTGVETSTIRFGANPPDFLNQLNFPHESSKFFQKQFLFGPSVSFNRLGNKMKEDSGISLGFEMGANFAPFKPIWKYGYEDENSDFIGNTITEIPQASRQSFYTSIKIGFWAAK
jgi:hypothetical protein